MSWKVGGIGEGIRTAGDFEDGQFGEAELRDAIRDQGIGFDAGIVASANVQGQRKRMIADVWRVVAGGAKALKGSDGYGGAEGLGERRVVVQSPNIRNR